jgi:hypothetical protein
MTRAIPLTPAEMFGRWKVLKQAGRHPTTGEILYWVECSCGRRRKRLGSLLRGGKTKSCRKCMLSSRLQDLTGERFGLLLVLGRVPNTSPLMWKCKCTGCGRIREVAGFSLRSGRSLSCGSCGKRKKHGHARAGAKSYYYQIWARTVHLNRGNPPPQSTGVGRARVASFDSSRMCWTILAPSQSSLASDSYVSIPVKGFFPEIWPGGFQSPNGGSEG